MIYITSDLHLGHDKPFIYKARGFESIGFHDAEIIHNINEVVTAEDELYILGDLMLGDNEHGIEMLKQIKCKNIHIILGNHCTNARINLYCELPHVASVSFAERLKFRKWTFMLSHYPMIMGDNSIDQTKLYCLAGHTHTTNRFLDIQDKTYHVELDAHYNYPISIEAIIKDIKENKHDN